MTAWMNYLMPFVCIGAMVFFVVAALVSFANQPPPPEPKKPDHGRRVR